MRIAGAYLFIRLGAVRRTGASLRTAFLIFLRVIVPPGRLLVIARTLPQPSTLKQQEERIMGEDSKVTLSVIKADVGGFVGHTSVHPDLLDTARERLQNAKDKGKISDYHVLRCGDDIELVMTHEKGKDNRDIHGLAWNVFTACAEDAKRLKLYGAGQDLFKDVFSGNVKGMGPGVAEIEFIERKSEPVLIFMADKTSSGAWNLPLYRMFADPFSTPGLVIDTTMIEGFSFTVLDAKEGKTITLKCPEETYRLLALIGTTEVHDTVGFEEFRRRAGFSGLDPKVVFRSRKVCWQGRPSGDSQVPVRVSGGRGRHWSLSRFRILSMDG